ncbi:MAG: hypothetical protein HPY75_02505 [Actinobacteria bacterium]|nr:hypothetical protein [Actinomycetota bacterium]
MLTAAVAISAGEVFPELLAALDGHPSLEICGVARSTPDLFRLLFRFGPTLLIASTCFLDEIDLEGVPADRSRLLSIPLTIVFPGDGLEPHHEMVTRITRLPIRMGGIIDRDSGDVDHVLQYIKSKVDIYSNGHAESSLSQSRKGSNDGLIVFSGCKGGVGNTLISCSFAAISALGEKRVILVEMGGARSQLIHLKSTLDGKTFTELAPMAEELSWDLLRVSLYRHPSGFHLLPSSRRSVPAQSPNPRVYGSLLRNLLFLFDLVILDLQNPWGGEFSLLLPFSPLVNIVTLPDMLSTACARDAAESMRRGGMDASRMRLLVNRYGGNHVLGLEEMARATGMDVTAAFPDDARSGLDFCEMGEVPRPTSPLGKATASLAVDLGLIPPGSNGARPRPDRPPYRFGRKRNRRSAPKAMGGA